MSRCECPKEADTQSSFSPGLVSGGEIIVYALVNPLTSSVGQVSKSQLKTASVSVCRAGLITGPKAKEKTVDVLITKNTTRTHEGFLHALCEEIRDIKLGKSSVGAFCVIDDALEDYRAHAHLGYSEPLDPKLRNERETARANLMLRFQKRGVRTDWAGQPFLEERKGRMNWFLQGGKALLSRVSAIVARWKRKGVR